MGVKANQLTRLLLLFRHLFSRGQMARCLKVVVVVSLVVEYTRNSVKMRPMKGTTAASYEITFFAH